MTMLGLNTKRTLVRGKFARDIQAKIQRIQKAQLNQEDLQEIRDNQNVVKRIRVHWK